MTFKLSETSLKRLEGVDHTLKSVIYRALEISPIDFGIPQYGGLRTAEEQNDLFSQDPPVTRVDGYKKRSRHQDGDAFDIYAYVDGKASWDTNHMTTVAAAILQAASELGVRLEWGGHWPNFKDYPHFQIKR